MTTAAKQDAGQETTGGAKSMDELMALCKRRGFVYQASEIYGGINGFWDYGPLGAQLKKNLRDAWWNDVVMTGCCGQPGPMGGGVEIVGLDTCIIQNPKVWEASGHVGGFNDPMVDDKETKQRFRADHLQGVFDYPDYREHGEVLKHVADETILPLITVVASTSSEAIQLLADDKRLRKLHGIQSLGGIEEIAPSIFAADAKIKGRDLMVVIHAVTPDLLQEYPYRVPSPFTGKEGSLTEPRAFNLMFKTYIGATASEDDKAYLRPETAQGIFINFKNVLDTTRVEVPFGIAQTGKAFRNEVTPRNFTFRSREFEQMEIEFFCPPEQAKEWYTFWRDWRMAWWQELGLAGENLRLRGHESDELAHYAKTGAGTSDIEYRFPFTYPDFGELEGIADRSTYDLEQHQAHSGAKLQYLDRTKGELAKNGQPKGQWVMPNVIEPSAGLDRGVLAVLCEAFTVDEQRASGVVMKFHPRLAPIKAAVFPLVNKDGMPEVAEGIARQLRAKFGRYGFIEYDAKQSIGKRYARMDEAGCPLCVTVDGQSLEDGTVTVRDRDTLEQVRVATDELVAFVEGRLGVL